MAEPITDPSIPFLGPIEGGLEDGRMVRIQGFTPPDGQRFTINLQTGPQTSPRDDVALHLSVRILEGYIARNTLQNGSWGAEQAQGVLPIGVGERFEIIILVGLSDFKVAVNGNHFCEFPQRIPASKVTHLAIEGTVGISLISFEGNTLTSKSIGSQEGGMQAPPSEGQYGPPPNQYGPPPGQYGPPGQFGPQQYGPPGQYPPYGPQQGGYGPPGPPPGHQPESGLDSFLDNAQSLIAGAISSGMADKLIGSLTGGGNANQQGHQNQQPYQQHQNYNAPPPQQQQQGGFNLSNLGGQGSLGGLGSVGSLLSSFADTVLQPKKDPKNIGIVPPKPGLYEPSAPTIDTKQTNPSIPTQGFPSTLPYPPNTQPGKTPFQPKAYPQGNNLPSYPPANSTYPPGNNPTYPPRSNLPYPPGSNFPHPPRNNPPYPSRNNPPYPSGNNPPYPPGNNLPYGPRNPPGNQSPYPPGPSNSNVAYPPGMRPHYHQNPSYPTANIPFAPSNYPGFHPAGPTPIYPPPNIPPYGNQNIPHYRPPYGAPTMPLHSTYPAGTTQNNIYTGTKHTNSLKDKALKYGLPIVGTGIAAYALSKVVKFGSSSSSDSD